MSPIALPTASPVAVPASSRRWTLLVAGTVLAACAALALVAHRGLIAPIDIAALSVLAGLCAVGEMLPIRLADSDLITMSSAFAFAILLAFGLLPAMLVYGAASALADAASRTGPVKGAFNASQYALSLAAAAVVLETVGYDPSLVLVPPDVYAVAAGAATFFLVNHLLAGAAIALLSARPVSASVRGDFGFHLWTCGLQLVLAPVALVATEAHPSLALLVLVPLVGVYLRGRHLAAVGQVLGSTSALIPPRAGRPQP